MIMVKEEVFDFATEMKELRLREPEHFILKVESFSDSKLEKYESEEFEAGGFKWILVLFPNGDKKNNGSGHVSLYLKTSNSNDLPRGWEIEASFKLFVYNNLASKYLTFPVERARFNWLKTEWGFAQLLPLEYLKDTSNGYLFGDTCVFGAEIYVTNPAAKRQILSMNNEINTNLFSWTLNNFSARSDDGVHSERFKIGDVQWKLRLYPNNAEKDSKDKCIALYLVFEDDESNKLGEKCQVYAEYKFRTRNHANTDHFEIQYTGMFSYSGQGHGLHDFMPLSVVNNASKGFLKNDCLVVQVEFTSVNIIRIF